MIRADGVCDTYRIQAKFGPDVVEGPCWGPAVGHAEAPEASVGPDFGEHFSNRGAQAASPGMVLECVHHREAFAEGLDRLRIEGFDGRHMQHCRVHSAGRQNLGGLQRPLGS